MATEKSQIILIGKIAKDVEFKIVGAKGTKICNTTLLQTDKYKVGNDWKEKLTWYPIVFMGKVADEAEGNIHNGTELKIIAKYNTGSYDKNGTKVYTHNFIVQSYEVLSNESAQYNDDSIEGMDFSDDSGDLPF